MEEGGVGSLPGLQTSGNYLSRNDKVSPTIPARPAPPTPGGPHRVPGDRPPPPKIPNQEGQDKSAPMRPQRPVSVSVTTAPPKPQRPSSVSLNAKQNEHSSGRKRPEITIMSAQPMSEVGFRDLKLEKSPKTDRRQNPDIHSVPSLPPRRDLPEPLIPTPLSNTSLPPVPPRKDIPGFDSLPPVPPRTDHMTGHVTPVTSGESDGHSPSPKFRPPLPTSRPTVKPHVLKSVSDDKISSTNQKSPPVIAKRDFKHLNEEGLQTSLQDEADNKISENRPVPKPRALPSKSSPENVSSQKTEQSTTDKTENVDSLLKLDEDESPSLEPLKPKRPTIIRVDKSQKLSSDSSHVNGKNCDNITKVPSFASKKEGRSLNLVNEQSDKGSDSISGQKLTKPPPLAPKPKPGLPTKPKPTDNSKSDNWAAKVDAFNSIGKPKRPNIIRPPPKPKRVTPPVEDESNDKGDNLDMKPTETVPAKMKDDAGKGDNSSVKNDIIVSEGYVYAQVNKVRQEKKPPPVDDLNTDLESRPPPPVPKKRPSSICDITQALKEEEAQNKASLTSSAAYKHSNPELSGPQRDRPGKPVPRMRPMSYAASSDSQHEGQGQRRPPPPIIGKPPPPKVLRENKQTEDPQESKANTEPPAPPRDKKPPPRPTTPSVRPTTPPPRPAASPQSKEKDLADNKEISQSITQQKLGPLPSPPSEESRSSKHEAGPLRPPPLRPDTVPLHQATAVDKAERPPKPQSPRVSKPSKPPSPKSLTSDIPALPQRPGPSHPLYHYMLSVPHGVAGFDYQARELDELSFQAGTTILLLQRIDDSWLLGKNGDKEGIFPQEFVQIVVPLEGEIIKTEDENLISDELDGKEDTGSIVKPDLIGQGPRCRARFDFDGESVTDLGFEEGDYIQLLGREGDEWLKGKFNGKIGLFPLSFVEIIEDLPLDDNQDISNIVTALYDFQSGVPTDLNFQTGDSITVISEVNDEWLYGESKGHQGQFPRSFIDRVPHNLPSYSAIEAGSIEHDSSSTPDLGTCTALYDFEGSSSEDLTFQEGEVITVTSQVDSDWLRGCIGDREGIFPVSFVKVHFD